MSQHAAHRWRGEGPPSRRIAAGVARLPVPCLLRHRAWVVVGSVDRRHVLLDVEPPGPRPGFRRVPGRGDLLDQGRARHQPALAAAAARAMAVAAVPRPVPDLADLDGQRVHTDISNRLYIELTALAVIVAANCRPRWSCWGVGARWGRRRGALALRARPAAARASSTAVSTECVFRGRRHQREHPRVHAHDLAGRSPRHRLAAAIPRQGRLDRSARRPRLRPLPGGLRHGLLRGSHPGCRSRLDRGVATRSVARVTG